MNILVVGGAGYIGTTSSQYLIDKGHNVFVVDNLSTGKESAIPAGVKYIICDMAAPEVEQFVNENNIDAVLLTAGYIQVGESVQDPQKYYENNIVKTIALLRTLMKCNVKKVVFSSSCAVNGAPETMPIHEGTKIAPINPYGYAKAVVEQILADYHKAYDLDYTILRYFNASGAHAGYGENHDPETHLIPNILRTIQGHQPHLEMYGDDYPTKDGTAVRDYIHVRDLAEGHRIALTTKTPSHIYCLGTGNGYSLREIIDTCEKVTGEKIPVVVRARRAGDPPVLHADSSLAQSELGWTAQHSSIENIIRDAWEHHRKQEEI
ncbi:MAG: UDP-glucose 4-epimerase GalE [Candidatus Paceibacterota bacterium]